MKADGKPTTGGQTVMRDNDGNLHYMLTDHPSASLRASLGSVVAITNSTGGVEYEQRYLPFGGVRELSDYSTTQPVTDFTYTSQRTLDPGPSTGETV